MTTPATTKLFLDTEFTGLHQRTTLISLALVAETGEEFYAEFTDYDRSQVDPWIAKNVVDHLLLYAGRRTKGDLLLLQGDTTSVKENLEIWLQKFDSTIEIWSDTLAYDWMLFCDLFGGAQHLPKNIYYIPFDLATVFRVLGLNPDLSRVEMAELYWKNSPEGRPSGSEHNALFDARVQLACCRTLQRALKRTRKLGQDIALAL
jgi:hypothetical protein